MSNQNIVTPKLGMVLGSSDFTNKPGFYKYAKNAVVEDVSATGMPILQNESSNFLSSLFPEGYLVIGKRKIRERNRTIYILTDPVTGSGMIGEVRHKRCTPVISNNPMLVPCASCDGGYASVPYEQDKFYKQCVVFRPIVTSSCFGFSESKPVRIRYRLTSCGLNIYFVDDLNDMRYMHFDLDSVGDLQLQEKFYKAVGFDTQCQAPIYGTQLDCNKIRVFPEYSRPCTVFSDIISGGNLNSGMYQFFVAMSDAVGNALTTYLPCTNQIPIFERSTNSQFGVATNQAILVNFSQIDKDGPYRYFNLVVCKTIQNQKTYELAAVLSVTAISYLYTGEDAKKQQLDENDLLAKKPVFKSARIISAGNDTLFYAGLKEHLKGNWQRLATKIKVYWETIQLPERAFAEARNVEKYRSLDRDEVYALGIIFEFDNDEETLPVLLINKATPPDGDLVIHQADRIEDDNCADLSFNEYWRAYNTAKVVRTPRQPYEQCKDTTWEWGEFAYWQSTEKYPDNEEIWGEYACQPILHFKTPDTAVSPFMNGQEGIDADDAYEKTNFIYPLGIRVDHDTVANAVTEAVAKRWINQEQASRIRGYRIVRGNRAGQSSVIAKGLLYDMNQIGKNNKTYYYPNYPFNDTNRDPFISPTDATYNVSESDITDSFKNPFVNTGRYTFHSPEIHFANPNIGIELKIEAVMYGKSQGFFNEVDEHAKYRILTRAGYFTAFAAGMAAGFSKGQEQRRIMKQEGPNAPLDFTGVPNDTPLSIVPAYTQVGFPQNSAYFYFPGTFLSGGDGNRPVFTGRAVETESIVGSAVRAFLNPTAPLNPLANGAVSRIGAGGYIPNPLAALMGAIALTTGIGTKTMQQFFWGLTEADAYLDMIKKFIRPRNPAVQYQGVGNYNCFTLPKNGIRRRRIVDYAYLKSEIQNVPELQPDGSTRTVLIQNYHRESSLYLKLQNVLPTAAVAYNKPDNSRFTMGDVGDSSLGHLHERSISAYYVSLKNIIPDQYGQVYDIEFLEIGACSFDFRWNGRVDIPVVYEPCIKIDTEVVTNQSLPLIVDNIATSKTFTVYGGDVFISRFALKRKMPFFIMNAFRAPEDSDMEYSRLGNVGYPNFYFDTPKPFGDGLSEFDIGGFIRSPLNEIAQVLGMPNSRLDRIRRNMFNKTGYMYLFSYGIPYFLVESRFNTNFRTGRDTKHYDFYPRNTELSTWLQEKNVSINEDNHYEYDRSYSTQSGGLRQYTYAPDFRPNRECDVDQPNALIYSLKASSFDKIDNWNMFLSSNYTRFDRMDGDLVSIDPMENEKMLVRLQHNLRVFNAYVTLQTSADTATVDTGGMFESKAQEYIKSDLGDYGGEHQEVLATKYGRVWINADKGAIYLMAPNNAGISNLVDPENEVWFKENLKFKILSDFPEMTYRDTDNAFNYLGFSMVYDAKLDRLLITKLDFSKLDSRIVWKNGGFYIYTPGKESNDYCKTSLLNGQHFCSRCFTLSYSFKTKSWISYHDYKPNWYVEHDDYFETGVNPNHLTHKNATSWQHNVSNKSFQIVYGRLRQFYVDVVSNQSVAVRTLNSLLFKTKAYRYHTDKDVQLVENMTFNKALVYSDAQNSGLRALILKNNNDNTITSFGFIGKGLKTDLFLSKGQWQIKNIRDLLNHRLSGPHMLHNCGTTETFLNEQLIKYDTPETQQGYFKDEQVTVRLIQDVQYAFKLQFYWLFFYDNQS